MIVVCSNICHQVTSELGEQFRANADFSSIFPLLQHHGTDKFNIYISHCCQEIYCNSELQKRLYCIYIQALNLKRQYLETQNMEIEPYSTQPRNFCCVVFGIRRKPAAADQSTPVRIVLYSVVASWKAENKFPNISDSILNIKYFPLYQE